MHLRKAILLSAWSACVTLLASCGGSPPEPGTVVLPPAAPTPDPPASESREDTARAAKPPPPPPSPPPRSAEPVRGAPPLSPAAAKAEELFREAKLLMAAGSILQACAKFEASNTLDPAPGTLLNLAACEEKAGHLPRACGFFRQTAVLTQAGGQVDRARYATERADKLGCPP